MKRGIGLLIGLLAGCRPHVVRPMGERATVSLREPAEADLVYLVMVDRFANGDESNDHTIDLDDPHGWHGGDIAGVRQRLDHLEALGVRTVWLTPVSDARDEKVGEWGAFHGYWLQDPWRVEPRFGTVEELRALSDDLHARGMRLVVDMVWNHTDYQAPVLLEHPDWFHETGDITDWDDPVQRVEGRVHGLPDLAQEDPRVAAWLEGSASAWIDRVGLDGMRIDAVGHMPRSFLSHMNSALDAHARKRGNPGGVWTLAEDFTGDPLALARTVEEGGFDAIFDFSMHYALVDVACRGADPRRLGATLSLDRYGPPPDARVTFLDNHDLPRITHVCGAEQGGSESEGRARVDAALLLLFAIRGTPCLSWGTEALVDGGEEPHNRPDLPWQQVGRRSPAIALLQELRTRRPALSKGTSEVVEATEQGLRIWRRSGADVAVIDVKQDISVAWSPAALPASIEVDEVVWVGSGDEVDGLGRLSHATGTAVSWDGVDLLERSAFAVPDWTVRVSLGRLGGTTPHDLDESDPQRLTVVVEGVPAGGQLGIVGAHPELGGWDPARAVVAEAGEEAGSWVAHIDLVQGDVVAFKPVWTDPAGVLHWSPAADRFAHLAGDLDQTRVVVDWSAD